MKIHGHGENYVTITLLTELAKKGKIQHLLRNAVWVNTDDYSPAKVSEKELTQLHLFPNFGKRYGYGEPDAIILSETHVIYVEVELADFSVRSLPKCFTRQMKQFVLLARDLDAAPIRRIVETFTGQSGYRFYGPQRLRRLFRHIKSGRHRPSFLVISDGKNVDMQHLAKAIDMPARVPLGWIGFPRIRYMKGISSAVSVIVENLAK